jgi:hypothetical protein
MDEHGSNTESQGALTPAPRHPPAAMAASSPLLPVRPSASHISAHRGLRGLIESALDGLDTLADRIASAAGLR